MPASTPLPTSSPTRPSPCAAPSARRRTASTSTSSPPTPPCSRCVISSPAGAAAAPSGRRRRVGMKLRLAHLYPRLMNIYGDRGNILARPRRCRERGIDFEVDELELGDKLRPRQYDMVFMGGAPDREQRRL